MNLTVAEGTIRTDGTLVLDEKLKLPAGRVTVVLQPVSIASTSTTSTTSTLARPLDDEFFQMMERIWAGQRARGFVPRSADEVEAERQRMRDDSEDEIASAIRLRDEIRRRRLSADSEKVDS